MSLLFSKLLAFNRVRYWREASHGLNRVSHFIGRALAWEPSFQRVMGVISCWLDVRKKGIVNYSSVKNQDLIWMYTRDSTTLCSGHPYQPTTCSIRRVSVSNLCTYIHKFIKMYFLGWRNSLTLPGEHPWLVFTVVDPSDDQKPLSNGKCEMKWVQLDLIFKNWTLSAFCREGQVFRITWCRLIFVSEWKMSWPTQDILFCAGVLCHCGWLRYEW